MAATQNTYSPEKELPLDWKIAMRVWWSIFWRAVILSLVAGGLMTLTLNVVGRGDETITLIFTGIGVIISIVFEVWLIHHALSQNYGSFRIAIVRKEPEKETK